MDAAAQVARVLFDGWVEKDQAPPVSRTDVSVSMWPRYLARWRLYREAMVLMVLLGKEQKDPRYSKIIEEYERLIYPSAEPTAEGVAKASALKSAMRDIAELIGDGDTGINSTGNADAFARGSRWSRKWFEDLGGLPGNPVTCWMFALGVMELSGAIARTVSEMGNQGIVP